MLRRSIWRSVLYNRQPCRLPHVHLGCDNVTAAAVLSARASGLADGDSASASPPIRSGAPPYADTNNRKRKELEVVDLAYFFSLLPLV
jgi:hypothetical protein